MGLSSSTAGFSSPLGSSLMELLNSDEIEPGSEPGYQICKVLYRFHPLGAKIVETPVKIAQSQDRQISVDGAPDEVAAEFQRCWSEEALHCDYYIRGLAYQSRIYGAGALIVGEVGGDPSKPLDVWRLKDREIYFNVFDPLNVAGSLVLDQNPNSPMFQKHGDIAASGQKYHRSRSCVMFNEQPIYIAYTSSAFGFSGRSVYQRALYPLKSFIQTMVTDDMVTRKAGLLIAMLKAAGSIVNRIMQGAAKIKRQLLQKGETDNVLSIDTEESIESLNMQNIDKAMITARSNVVKNIATACDMPAQILEQESFAEGFGEGTEDTKAVIRFVNGVRKELGPAYRFCDRITQHVAWSEEFFVALARKYPEAYKGKDYKQVFYEWQKGFKATWPNLLEEPESEQAKIEKVRLEGLISVAEVLMNKADPDNIGSIVQWVVDNCNGFKRLFHVGLELDVPALTEYVEEELERRRDGEDAATAGDPNQEEQQAGGGKQVRPRLSLTARGDDAAAPPPPRRRKYGTFWG